MDDLIIYLINLFQTDPVLLSIFTGAGAKAVLAYNPYVRQETSYPRIIVYGEEGADRFSGGQTNNMSDGFVCIRIYTRQSDENPNALATLVAIKNRLLILTKGQMTSNGHVAVPEVRGTTVGRYYVTNFQQSQPTGTVPYDKEPTIRSWRTTFRTTLLSHVFSDSP